MSDFDAFVDSLIETDLEVMAAAPNKGAEPVRYPCGQCSGTGRYQGARVHQEKSHCFACRGLGYFKASPEARRKHRDAAKARARNKLEVGLAAFAENHPSMFADLRDASRAGHSNEFISSLAHQLFTKGSLSDRQIEAWARGKARLAEVIAKRAAEAEERKVVGVDLAPIRAMFDTAKASGLKKTAYRAEGLVLKAAPDSGRNAGALYITDDEGTYLGKLVGAIFHPLREAPATVGAALLTIAADPKEAAGRCSCCGRELTDATSVSMGIGPICAQKWGF